MENIVGEMLSGIRLEGIREFRNMAVAPISHDISGGIIVYI